MYDDLIKDIDGLVRNKAFLTVDEVAQILNCNKKVVYNWTRRKDLKRRPPRMSIGKTIRFPKAAFVQWLVRENGIGN